MRSMRSLPKCACYFVWSKIITDGSIAGYFKKAIRITFRSQEPDAELWSGFFVRNASTSCTPVCVKLLFWDAPAELAPGWA
jgi:hypothetical protein